MERNSTLKSFILLVGLVLVSAMPDSAMAQIGENRYLVYFTDKDNTPYSLSNPEAFLSERAILRRQNQGIDIDQRDLPVDPEYVQAILDLGEVEVIYSLKWFNAILIQTTDQEVIDAISELDIVNGLEVSPVIVGKDEVEESLTDIVQPKSNGAYGAALNQIDMINGLPLHDAGNRGQGIWIGVFDGGFSNLPTAAVFQPLLSAGRILGAKDFVHGDGFVYDYSSHGTYVMSTMAADVPNLMIGTAPEASYLLCVTEDVSIERRIEEANWIAAAEYADSMGIDVINTSLGYTEFDVESENYTYADMDGNTALITRGSDIAASKGILMVSSAGNKGQQDWFFISAPADGDSVLAIGAVNAQGIATGFSSRGPSFDGRVKPNVMAQGGATVITNLGDSVTAGNGTSFSGPIIAGMAASLWGALPAAKAWEVHEAIEQSAHLHAMPNDSMGYGIPDFGLAYNILSQVVSVSDIESRKGSLITYPNPYQSGVLKMQFPEYMSGKASLNVFDITGRKVQRFDFIMSEGSASAELTGRLDQLQSGTYILELVPNTGRPLTGRLLKH